uniref:Uncharacterized protein n=1 Tax=Arundo donax TaxID=35708 RepID=A0A0A9AQU1_ARUDO
MFVDTNKHSPHTYQNSRMPLYSWHPHTLAEH